MTYLFSLKGGVEVYNPPFKSDIFYSVQNEDYQTELAATSGPFDLISLSNIADWMNEAQFSATVTRASECLKPGGALLARTATGRPMIVEVMGQHIQMDSLFNAELSQIERGPWFRIIAVGFRR
jgi:hypothetical protein